MKKNFYKSNTKIKNRGLAFINTYFRGIPRQRWIFVNVLLRIRSLPKIITSKSGKFNKELTKVNLEDTILTSAWVMPFEVLEKRYCRCKVYRKVTGFEVIKLND